MKKFQLRQGNTRVVLLCGDKAIKIAKFKPIDFLLRLISFPFRKGFEMSHREIKLVTEHHVTDNRSSIKKAWHCFAIGILANKIEYNFWQETKCEHVMPTTNIYLGGIITVQPRGEEVNHEELHLHNPFAKYIQLFPDFSEIKNPIQFARRNGKIFLIDYGKRSALPWMYEIHKMENFPRTTPLFSPASLAG